MLVVPTNFLSYWEISYLIMQQPEFRFHINSVHLCNLKDTNEILIAAKGSSNQPDRQNKAWNSCKNRTVNITWTKTRQQNQSNLLTPLMRIVVVVNVDNENQEH